MRRIGLLGATGYTGRLTATEFAVRDIAVRLGGRSAERLSRVDGVGASERVTVDTSDAVALRQFLDGLDVVISTVGPFTQLGMPVAKAAVDAGVHYVDSTGEFGFMQELYDAFRDAATAVVPACGLDYLPGDCAAALAVADLSIPPERIEVGYDIHRMRATRGTARSSIEAAAAAPNPRLRRTQVAGRPGIELPWGEQVTIPMWAPGVAVATAVTAPRALQLVAPIAGPLAGPALRVGAPLLRRIIDRLPEGPTDEVRGRARIRVIATAHSGSRSATVSVEVLDVYAFTALALVESALRVGGTGAMAPSQAFDPAGLLDALSGPMLSWQRTA